MQIDAELPVSGQLQRKSLLREMMDINPLAEGVPSPPLISSGPAGSNTFAAARTPSTGTQRPLNFAEYLALVRTNNLGIAAQKAQIDIADVNRPVLNRPLEVGQTSKGFMEKYKTEFKLKVVKSFMAGDGGAKLLAR